MVDLSFKTNDDRIDAVVPPGRSGLNVFDGITGSWPSGAALALWVFVGLLAYLFIGNIASTFLLALNGVGLQDILSGQQDIFAENGNAFLGGNAIGLALGLGSVALLASWLDSSRPLRYLRLKSCNAADVALSLAGLICLLPAVLGLGILNEKIPLPDVLMQLEEQQMELIEWFTGEGGNFALNMVYVVAAPALFEEMFFRGYVQRRAERGLGVAAGIILTGVIFGVFHLRLTQVLPLILLGCYLAYVTWRTGSLWIAVVLHFFNNGLALSLSKWGPNSVADPEVIPWLLIMGGTILFAACILTIHRRNEKEHR
ncbi:MAG: CPBP family intramembrane metalloprotease [Rhodothermaceae bacterium]|nr:CPBP family intramembrane metalloprotease [Rhodothermaceae bacterium]MYH07329.1 CPBP family intramembrane metalloprotease [Rhodothermaceae bacterium]